MKINIFNILGSFEVWTTTMDEDDDERGEEAEGSPFRLKRFLCDDDGGELEVSSESGESKRREEKRKTERVTFLPL
jgi:hypothetical protein